MKAFATLIGLSLVSALSAQSTITTTITGLNSQGVPGTMFFDMTVSAATGTIQVTKLEVRNNSVAGTEGQIRFWQTIPGFGFSGSETNRSRWSLLAQGNVISTGQGQAAFCFETPVTLTNAMGTRGYAVEYVGLIPLYTTGNGTNQNYSNADLSIACGATQQNISYFDADATEVGGVAFHVGVLSPRVFNGVIHYSTGAAQPCAYSHKRGLGCGADVGSWFDKLHTNDVASASLTGNGLAKRTVTMIPDGLGGYSVLNTTGGSLIPTAGHNTVNLTLGTFMAGNVDALDDGEHLVPPTPLTWSFPAAGGAVNQLYINTNGAATTSSLQAFLTGTGGIDWAPRLSDLLNGPTGWYPAWHDFDFNLGGAIKWFDTGTQLIVTWEGAIGTTSLPTELNTFQMTFDQSGVVTMFWDLIDPVFVAYYSGTPWLVGYSHTGASIRPAETNLANPSPFNFGQWKLGSGVTEVGELQLTASPRPVGSPVITYTHKNLQFAAQMAFSIGNPFAPAGGLLLASADPSFTQPQCLINFDIGAFGLSGGTAGPGTVVDAFTLDTLGASLLGIDYWVQAVGLTVFTPPVINPTLITSNALHQRVENN